MRYESTEDMPILNFIHCMNGEYEYLYEPKQQPDEGDGLAFSFLACEYFDMKRFKTEIKYFETLMKYLSTGNATHKNNLMIMERQLQENRQVLNIIDSFYSELASINRILGMNIDPKTTSTKLYYSYLNDIKRNVKQ